MSDLLCMRNSVQASPTKGHQYNADYEGRMRRGLAALRTRTIYWAKGLMKKLTVRPIKWMLASELTAHLGYEPGADPIRHQCYCRNGTLRKTVTGNDGALLIDVPRDWDGRFTPVRIKTDQTRIDGMDDKIIGLCAAGLSTRDFCTTFKKPIG